jgi:hypothetical protein
VYKYDWRWKSFTYPFLCRTPSWVRLWRTRLSCPAAARSATGSTSSVTSFPLPTIPSTGSRLQVAKKISLVLLIFLAPVGCCLVVSRRILFTYKGHGDAPVSLYIFSNLLSFADLLFNSVLGTHSFYSDPNPAQNLPAVPDLVKI